MDRAVRRSCLQYAAGFFCQHQAGHIYPESGDNYGVTSIRDATRQTVELMEQGVSDVNLQLQNAGSASDDNEVLHNAVEQLFEVISVMETNSKEHGRQASQVARATESMGEVVRTLRISSDQVRETAQRLHQLSDSFQVSADRA